MWLEGLGQLEKSSDLIGTRTRHLPAHSILPQPSTLLHSPGFELVIRCIEFFETVHDYTFIYLFISIYVPLHLK
jgi:hypothetical protein